MSAGANGEPAEPKDIDMTAHLTFRSDRIDPISGSGRTETRRNKRPLGRNVATGGAVLVVLAAGFGLTQLNDGGAVERVAEPEYASAVDLTAGTNLVAGRPDGFWTPVAGPAVDSFAPSGRVVAPGMPDGTWQAPQRSTTGLTGRMQAPGRPDGHWAPAAAPSAARDSYVASPQVLLPGMPDGTWDAGDAGSNGQVQCPVRGYC